MVGMAPKGYVPGTSQLGQVQTAPTKRVIMTSYLCALQTIMIKKRHYDVILCGGFRSTKSDHKLMSHLCRFFAGRLYQNHNLHCQYLNWKSSDKGLHSRT